MNDAIRSHYATYAKSGPVSSYEEAFIAGWDACRRHMDGVTPSAKGSVQELAEQIYNAYPRKVGKGAALRAIINAMRPGVSRAPFLLERVQAFAAATAHWPSTERIFIPHPATWFNAARYDDDPKEWDRGGQTSIHCWK